MAKRHVQVGGADADAAPPAPAATPPRGGDGKFLAGRQLETMPEPSVRQWENDANPFNGPRAEIEQVLAAEAAEAAAAAGEKPPGTVEPNPDPDGGEVADAPADGAAPPASTQRTVTPTYLNAAQRADLTRKLDESKRERQKDAEIKRINDEHAALQAKLNSPRLADRIAALGKTPEELLEDLLLGKADGDDRAVAAAAGIDPTVARLQAKIDAMEKRDADRETAAKQAEGQRVQQNAIALLRTNVTAANGYHMIAALKQHAALLAEIEKDYDGVSDINGVQQVVADRVEGELRRMYPEAAAVLAAGGTVTAVTATEAQPRGKAKVAVGASGGTGRAVTTDSELPLDAGERHLAVKDRFFPQWKR